MVNDSVQVQELINEFTGYAQLHIDDYLNIGNQVLNDDINSMPSSSSDESESDTNIPKIPIYQYCSEESMATEVLILFFQQQTGAKS